MSRPRTLEWIGDRAGFLRLLDQTQLPTVIAFRDCRFVEDVWEAIRSLRVRGAPAIGVAAAFGAVLGVQGCIDAALFESRFLQATGRLRTSRPTAVNLFWALERMERCRRSLPPDLPTADKGCRLLAEAQAICEEDRRTCHAIGEAGVKLIENGMGVLTHCNAGGLATVEHGTALAVLFAAAEQGRHIQVFADETRPLLQGARLTAWEFQQHGIPVTLICDSMAGQVMKEGRVQLVIVGADRIAANGDAANKIGTYSVAVLAHHHRVPFYVAAPLSTFDLDLPNGDGIPIEQRNPREITHGFGQQTAPDDIDVYNPAFDVTPHDLISGIITEKGLIRPVNRESVRAVHQRL